MSGQTCKHWSFPPWEDEPVSQAVSYIPDSKVHGDNMGPIWGRQDPGGPHVGPMNFCYLRCFIYDCNSIFMLRYTWRRHHIQVIARFADDLGPFFYLHGLILIPAWIKQSHPLKNVGNDALMQWYVTLCLLTFACKISIILLWPRWFDFCECLRWVTLGNHTLPEP